MDFFYIITEQWQAHVMGDTPTEVCQNKIKHLRRSLRGWACHRSGTYKKEKERLLGIIDSLHIEAKTNPLQTSEHEVLRKTNCSYLN